MEAIFKFELCSYPPALFDSSLMLLQPHKPALANAIWAMTMESSDVTAPQGELQFVLDGVALIHRIRCPQGCTRNVCALYCNYVHQKCGKAIIVFDGDTSTSTKSMTQEKRTGGKVGATVTFTDDMKLTVKKAHFQANKTINSPSLIYLVVIFSRAFEKSTTRQLMLICS